MPIQNRSAGTGVSREPTQPDPPVGERRLRECQWGPCATLRIPADGRSRFGETLDISALQVRTFDEQMDVSLTQVTAVGEISNLSDPRFATERVTCIDTTAAGGNASLMAAIEERQQKIAEGLAAADRSKKDLAQAEETVTADGLFVMIGAQPHTAWLPPAFRRDVHGFVLTGADLGAEADGLDKYAAFDVALGRLVERIRRANTATPGFIFVGRPYAAQSGADFLVTESFLTGVVQRAMIRKDQVCARADLHTLGRDFDTLLCQTIRFDEKRLWIDDHAIAEHACFTAVHDSRGQQVQDKRLVADLNRVASVVTALVASDDVETLGDLVADLPEAHDERVRPS